MKEEKNPTTPMTTAAAAMTTTATTITMMKRLFYQDSKINARRRTTQMFHHYFRVSSAHFTTKDDNDNDNRNYLDNPSTTFRTTTAHRIIEPPIRSRPFRHFRGSSGGSVGGSTRVGSSNGNIISSSSSSSSCKGSGIGKIRYKSPAHLRRLSPTNKRVNLVQHIGSAGVGGGMYSFGGVHQRSKPASDTFQGGDKWTSSRWENHDRFPGQQQLHPQNIDHQYQHWQLPPSHHQQHHHGEEESFRAPVRAIHVGQSIDLAKVISKVFVAKAQRKLMEKLSVVVQLQPLPVDPSSSSPYHHRHHHFTDQRPRFVAVFRYGSVVFFNVSPREAADLLSEIKQYTTQPVLSGSELKENYCVTVMPNLVVQPGSMTTTSRYHHRYYTHQSYEQYQELQFAYNNSIASDDYGEKVGVEGMDDLSASPPSQPPSPPPEVDVVTGDHCVVPELNLKAVDVISSTIAQSVALDSYNDTVDSLLSKFEKVNKSQTSVPVHESNNSLRSRMRRLWSGEKPNRKEPSTLDRDELFRAVAQNNSIFIDMVSKVGIKDRIDTAWNMSQYEDISEGMREEFDIDQRFEHLEFKLNLIQENAKFFLEVLAHQKSNSLEIIIIVLILFECILMIAEMYLTIQGMAQQ